MITKDFLSGLSIGLSIANIIWTTAWMLYFNMQR